MDNLNTISYDEGWKDAYTPVHHISRPEQEEQINPVKEKKKVNIGIPLLTIVQLIICLIAVIAAYGIKTFGGDLYKTVHNWYYEQMSDEIIMNESFETFSLDSISSFINGNTHSNSDNDTKNTKH